MNFDEHYIDELIYMREEARNNKDWQLSDEIREYLDTKSVIIMDTKDGQVVYNELPGTTREQLVERLNKDRQAEALFEAWLFSMKESAKKVK